MVSKPLHLYQDSSSDLQGHLPKFLDLGHFYEGNGQRKRSIGCKSGALSGTVGKSHEWWRGTSCPYLSDKTALSLEVNLLWLSLDEFPYLGKAGPSHGFPKSHANSVKKQKPQIRCSGKERWSRKPGWEPLQWTEPDKVGGEHRPGSVGQVVVAQGFSRGVRKASLTLKMQDCFRLTPKSEGPPVVSFKLWPPLLYSSCNEAIIHNDKILESICIIHFFS